MNWFKKYFRKHRKKALQIAEEKILIQESRFRCLIDNSLDVIAILSDEGKPLYVSSSVERILGYTEEETLQKDIFTLAHPEDLPLLVSVVEQVVNQPGEALQLPAVRVLHKEGEWRWLEARATNLLLDPGINGIVINLTDVTVRKQSEEKLLHAKRLYAFLSQINQAIVHASDEQMVFKESCRISVEVGGLSKAWIGAFDPAALRVEVVESFGLSAQEEVLINQIPYHDKEPQHQVLSGSEYFVCNDIRNSDLDKWKSLAQSEDINSVIIVPIRKAGGIYGTINLYASQTDFFNEQEIRLLKEAAGDISFALDVFKRDKQRLNAKKELRHKDLMHRQAEAMAHLGSWERDFSTGKSMWSEESCRIYGVPLTDYEQTQESWLKFIHPDDLNEVKGIIKERNVNLSDTSFRFRIIRGDGEIRYLFQQAQFILDEKGRATGMFGASHDVTDMQNAEDALQDMVNFNKTLIDVTPIGIASFVAPTGICLSVNKAFADIIGARPEEYIGLNFNSFSSWESSGLLEDATETIETGKVIQREIFFTSMFGNEKWINYRFVRFFDKAVPHLLLLMNDITEKKLTEKALQNSEFQFRNIVETAQEGIWLTDKEQLTLFVNRRMCEILEYSVDEIIGQPLTRFMDDAAKKKTAKAITDKEKKFGRYENVGLVTKSGKKIITLLSTSQMSDEEGNYKGAVTMVADVTEKAELEELLEKTNRLSTIGNYEIDLIKEKVYLSDITRGILEADPDLVLNLADIHSFYKDGVSKESIIRRGIDLFEKGIPYDEELQIVTFKGKEKWVRNIGEAEFLNGKCLRIYGSFQDIDERKRSQLEVLKSYEEKSEILESIADAFYAIDKNWIVTYWNGKSEDLLHTKREDILHKNLWEEYPDLIDSSLYKHYENALEDNKASQFEMFYDPVSRWFDISVYPSASGISVYFRDATERMDAEMHLKQLNKNLETYTNELVVSNKNLEQFSYIISHNLRTPVANILGIPEVLKDPSLEPEEKEIFTKSLTSSVVALDEVITDLNLILKKKQGVNESKEMVEFSSLVQKIQNSISALIKTENVSIITDFSAVVQYFTIKSYFHSIFYNLIINSIKYRIPTRPLLVTITSKERDNKVILSFKDNGSGIDLEKKGRQVFGLYKRFHTDIEGKGMGLFMVKSQVEFLGGKISVRSQPNQGTEFDIELPDYKGIGAR